MLVGILAMIALIVFGLMRNSAAKRNDKRREKLLEKQEELFESLKKKTSGHNGENAQQQG